ncbi:developmental pluripotency-associated protein 2 [Psammomys obesus]|uniref:developmental pluripotency-associated protein 2 n=1 Tax=Psammomys obesus TaxID=48139 RepID=UPI002452A0CD|nr:developmental pluripotency-associated protein 2 [Psammomys obesus]
MGKAMKRTELCNPDCPGTHSVLTLNSEILLLPPFECGALKNYGEEEFNEEEVTLTLVPVTEEPDPEEHAPEYVTELNASANIGVIPPGIIKLKNHGENFAPLPTFEQKALPGKHAQKTPLPVTLPPIKDVSRNTLREWCRYHNLSTDGKKVEVYLRLQRHSYSKQICHIPSTSLEARMKPVSRKPKRDARGTQPQDNCKSKKQKENGVVEILTSARGSTLAAWGRISMKAAQPESVNCRPLPPASKGAFLAEDVGCRWCIVHGGYRPANKKGWVRLQLHAGQTWVPEIPQKMISLFLLPACVFPDPGVDDNMLCPECVQSNKKILRNFRRKKIRTKNCNTLPLNMAP